MRSEYRSQEQFRSASLVELLVAVDVFERSGVADTDRRLVTAMLWASDDDAASVLWARFRDAVLGDLRATSRCAVDGREQLFGAGRSAGAAARIVDDTVRGPATLPIRQ